MATCRQIIETAYRKARVRAAGEALDAQEAADGLTTLQSLYDEMVGGGWFGRLAETLITADHAAEESERIYNTGAAQYSVTLPETITDEYTGEDRPPRDLSLVVVAGDTPAAYLYSAWRGKWETLRSLALADYAPLSERSHEGLAALLALRIAEENGVAPTNANAALAAAFKSRLTHRLDGPRSTTQTEFY